MTNGNTVCLEFHSTYEMLDFVQVASDHLGRLAGLDEGALHWVWAVAVRESVINAINTQRRRRAQARARRVTPLDVRRPSGIVIRVRDEGPGFDPEPSRIRWAPETC